MHCYVLLYQQQYSITSIKILERLHHKNGGLVNREYVAQSDIKIGRIVYKLSYVFLDFFLTIISASICNSIATNIPAQGINNRTSKKLTSASTTNTNKKIRNAKYPISEIGPKMI